MQTANAETGLYEFPVGVGDNTLDLGNAYNGSYVNSITGTVYESSLHYQEVTINVPDTDKIGTKRTLKLDVLFTDGMKLDFSDVYFTDRNFNIIPIYRDMNSTVNGSNATFYLYFDSIAAQNDLYMCWGVGSNPKQDSYVFLANFGNGETYTTSVNFNVYRPESLYNISTSPASTFNYTNAEVIFSMSGSGSNHNTAPWLRLKINSSNSSALTNSVGTWVEGGRLFLITFPGWMQTEIRPISTTIIKLESSLINSTLVGNANNITSIWDLTNNDWTNVFSFNRGSGSITIYSFKTYNSTNFTASFGEINKLVASEHPITISYPASDFSTLDFESEWVGNLEFRINYDPHAVLSTPNDATFQETAILQFEINPQNLQLPYQIALDDTFFSIVNSGSSSGIISVKLPANNYYWRVMQPDGNYSDIRTFTVTEPGPIQGSLNFTIRNELTNTSVSATVTISNNTTTLQKTGSTVTFNSSEVTAGNYSVRVNSTNNSTRFYEVVSPGDYTLYILPITVNTSVVYFSLIDNTNQFQYNSTKLEIIKQTTNGSIVVTSNYFDASGFVVTTLNQFDNYILKVVSDSGTERILGNYIQAGQTSIQLVISEIILKDPDVNIHGGFTYNLKKSLEGIKLEWRNPNSDALTEPFTFKILKDGEQVMNITSTAPFGLIHYIDTGGGELDPNATYEIIFEAETTGGKIRVHEFYKISGEITGINFDIIPAPVRIIVTIGLLVLVASQFNTTNAKFAAVVVSVIALFLSFVSFFPVGNAILVFVWLLFIAVVALKTSRRFG
jgi:hypothetical protein